MDKAKETKRMRDERIKESENGRKLRTKTVRDRTKYTRKGKLRFDSKTGEIQRP